MAGRIAGLSFSELWEQSKAFRFLFFHNRVFSIDKRIDLGKGELLWSERFPRTEWILCGLRGCKSLALAGEYCRKHQLEERGKMVLFQWHQGRLYKYISEHKHNGQRSKVVREYRRFCHHAWLRRHGHRGSLPSGYVIRFIDGNPFNQHFGNLALVSKVAAAAYDAGVIDVAEAIDLDTSLPGSIVRRLGPGRPRARWVYGTEAISKVAGISIERVRQDISRGFFDPADLASVLDFCKKRAG
jgi:hypothetical protein